MTLPDLRLFFLLSILLLTGCADNSDVRDVFFAQRSDVQVQGTGTVVKQLPDDNHGSRHQRFILRIHPDLTVLIAHNIDLAPRIPGLRVGDEVLFYGEYEWNAKGGVVHWTHRDPKNEHPHGWLRHHGKQYD